MNDVMCEVSLLVDGMSQKITFVFERNTDEIKKLDSREKMNTKMS